MSLEAGRPAAQPMPSDALLALSTIVSGEPWDDSASPDRLLARDAGVALEDVQAWRERAASAATPRGRDLAGRDLPACQQVRSLAS